MNRAESSATLAAALLLAACAACAGEPGARGTDASDVPEAERYGGTAVVGAIGEITAVNELVAPDYESDQVMAFVLFTTLIQYDERLQPAPYLAERWDTAHVGDSTIALTFHVRRDVRWHDGVPTTAHDVKFTFDRARDPDFGYPNPGFFALYDSARVEGDHAITFFLRPHSDFMDVWRAVSPMPRHILGDVPPEEMRSHPFNTQSPVGNGPFRFVSHRAQDRWVFEANPDFPEALGGRPYLDRVVYRVIPEETTLLTELLAGGVDIDLQVLPHHAERIQTHPSTRLLSFPTRQYVFVGWNGRHPILRSAAIRRALTLAIDREQIVQAVRHGYGIVAHGPIPPFHWAHDPEAGRVEHDPDRARAILEREGWVDADGDGVREREGIPLQIELKTNQNRMREDIIQMIQADLAKVGVQVRPRVVEWNQFVEDILHRRRFDGFILGWVTEFRIDDSNLFACDQREGLFQFADFCNPRVDTILAQATRMTRREDAHPLWREYQQTLGREQPFTWLYYEVRPIGVRARLRDVKMDIRGTWINARDWWLHPAERTPAPTEAAP